MVMTWRLRMLAGLAAVLWAGNMVGAMAADAPHPAAAPHILAVGSGEVGGAYYPEAGAVCRMVNRERSRHGLHCLVEPTAGSAVNLAGLRSGDLQLGLVLSRSLGEAAAGKGAFAQAGAFPELRSLISLHGEPVAVLLASGSKIKTPADLKGKRLNLGHPGSYQRSMAEALMEAEKIRPQDLASSLEMEPAKMVKALCDGQIDAAVVTGIHPIAEVQEALDECGVTLLPLKDAAIETYVKANPAYTRLLISNTDYQGLADPVPSFGLRAVLVTTSHLSDDDAYEVVKAVAGDVAPFRGMHPLLSPLDRKQMAREALTVPFHDGALRYFKEYGLP